MFILHDQSSGAVNDLNTHSLSKIKLYRDSFRTITVNKETICAFPMPNKVFSFTAVFIIFHDAIMESSKQQNPQRCLIRSEMSPPQKRETILHIYSPPLFQLPC